LVEARPRKQPISLRVEADAIDELKSIASREGIGHQTLIRIWVMERLEEETKAG
jgi:predicted DNA binding CopG/RHH family protein